MFDFFALELLLSKSPKCFDFKKGLWESGRNIIVKM